jgi:hypothetical protein
MYLVGTIKYGRLADWMEELKFAKVVRQWKTVPEFYGD